MEAAERDTTDEWRIAPERAPATVAELEGRIDVALATARSAEEAALEIGAASLEAAEQARRAAAMAECASAAAVRAANVASAPNMALVPAGTVAASSQPASAPQQVVPPLSEPDSNGIAVAAIDPFEERITAFRERAEQVMIRLQKLEAPQESVGSFR